MYVVSKSKIVWMSSRAMTSLKLDGVRGSRISSASRNITPRPDALTIAAVPSDPSLTTSISLAVGSATTMLAVGKSSAN